ncbi:MAG: hypothetical protein AAF204_03850 [Pseudomonadota bacterium]
MSRIIIYLLGFFALILVGGFAFFAISSPEIEQNEIIIEIPADKLG